MNGSVLVMDDDRAFAEMTALILRDAALEAIAFWDVRQALRAARAGKIAVDVALVDHRMPFCDGARFFERLRFAHPGVLGILVTGYTDSESPLESGWFDFMSKPFRNDDLLLRVFRALYAHAYTLQGAVVSTLSLERVYGTPNERQLHAARHGSAACEFLVVSGGDAEDSPSRKRVAERLRKGTRMVFCHRGFLPDGAKRVFDRLLAEIQPPCRVVRSPWRSWRDLREELSAGNRP